MEGGRKGERSLKPPDRGFLGSTPALCACVLSRSVAQSCPFLCDPMDCSPRPWDSPGKDTGVGCHALLQDLHTQESSLGLLYWQVDSLPLSHQGSTQFQL